MNTLDFIESRARRLLEDHYNLHTFLNQPPGGKHLAVYAPNPEGKRVQIVYHYKTPDYFIHVLEIEGRCDPSLTDFCRLDTVFYTRFREEAPQLKNHIALMNQKEGYELVVSLARPDVIPLFWALDTNRNGEIDPEVPLTLFGIELFYWPSPDSFEFNEDELDHWVEPDIMYRSALKTLADVLSEGEKNPKLKAGPDKI